MDFISISILSACAIVLSLCISTLWWYASVPRRLPPGPIGWPFIGSMMDTFKASTLLQKLMDWSVRYGPIYKLYVGNKLVVVLADYKSIHEALSNQGDTYAGRPSFHTISPPEMAGKGLTTSEGELWKIQRNFALRTLGKFGFGKPIIETSIKFEAQRVLDEISKHNDQPFDPASILSNAIANIICVLVFGRRFEYEDENFQRLLGLLKSRASETDASFLTIYVLSKRVSKLVSGLPQLQLFKKTNAQWMSFLHDQVNKALNGFDPKNEPTNYVQAFYKAQHESEENSTFTEGQLVASAGNLFSAGTDTTTVTLRWAIFLMAQHPDWQEKVYEEIRDTCGCEGILDYADLKRLPLVEAVIMETQRVADIAPFGVARRTMEPSKLGDYEIPAGAVIMPLLRKVHMNPDVYPEPEKFDPERFLKYTLQPEEKGPQKTHLMPFLMGKRVCLGERMARMEVFIFFTALMSKYRFSFPPNEKPPMEAMTSIMRAPIAHRICVERRSQ